MEDELKCEKCKTPVAPCFEVNGLYFCEKDYMGYSNIMNEYIEQIKVLALKVFLHGRR